MYFLHHLHLQDDTEKELLVSIGYTQFECGAGTQFFQLEYDKLGHFCTHSWCTHLSEESSKKKLSIKSGYQIACIP